MVIQSLGDLTEKGRLLIFGGCYSNLEATLALREWAEQEGFTADQCICTGDIVAYCADPVATVTAIQDWGVHCIQGNVEESLAKEFDDCGCGFDAGTTCDVLSGAWFSYADQQVNADQRGWFAALPQHISFNFAGKDCRVVHGSVQAMSRFMYASQADKNFLADMGQLDLVIAGHSGLPFTKTIDNKIWHNSGALGMPANDGTDRVWFSTLAVQDNGELEFQHHALFYNAAAAHARMLSVELTQGYHQTLLNGFWPSMDVLPAQEKYRVGLALEPEALSS